MKKKKKYQGLLTALICVCLAVLIVFGIYFVQKLNNKIDTELSLEDAQALIDETFANLPGNVSTGAKYVAQNTVITVDTLSYGTEKDIILECTYETVDIGTTVKSNIDEYLENVYSLYLENNEKGIKTNATKIKQYVATIIEEDIALAEKLDGEITIYLYETEPGVFTPYLSDEIVNTVLGGILDAKALIASSDKVIYNGEEVNISNLNTLRTGINDYIALKNYDSQKPDTSVPIEKLWNTLKYDFHRNFIVNSQYKYLTRGLATTIEITALAVLLGILIGFIVAVIRCVNQKTGKLGLLSGICKTYLSIMRGTPVMVQLLIMYFVVLLPLGVDKFPAAVICFGLNSGAYVSEIVRGGIMSIDEGQTEAGRSLGFSYIKTMWYIIIPQAFKAVLPSLANEFITLLKESSVAFYIGVADLTLGGIKIRSITYSNYMPLIAVALIYLVVVLGLSKCVSILERRLSKSDKR
ncbi:MAG: amino acid ABC transporter permease [Clostridia bacterium]|nr:amino acid ABC transporter permease [Clostridia bacterium]